MTSNEWTERHQSMEVNRNDEIIVTSYDKGDMVRLSLHIGGQQSSVRLKPEQVDALAGMILSARGWGKRNMVGALEEARAVAEMAVQDQIETMIEYLSPGEGLPWGDDERLSNDEFARRRLLELRQNVKDTEFRPVGDWDATLENKE